MRFASSIRTARERAGLTQADLALAAGVGARAVWQAEQGSGTLKTLTAIFGVLKIEVAGLPRGASVGERIKAVRLRRGWSLAEVAKRASVSVPTVRAIEGNAGQVGSLEAILTVLAPEARQRKSDRPKFSPGERDCRFTPLDVFQRIENAFEGFDLDPCGHPLSRVRAQQYYFEADDGLKQPWFGRVFLNPPFSSTETWLSRAHEAWSTGECQTVVALVPARTHTAFFYRIVHGAADVILMKGRIKFEHLDGAKDAAPFGTMLVVYGGSDEAVRRLRTEFEGVFLPRDPSS